MAACIKDVTRKNTWRPKMKCPNLVMREMHRCKTVDESYKPSDFQLWEYCKTGRHKICPFFVGYNRKQEGHAIGCQMAVC